MKAKVLKLSTNTLENPRAAAVVAAPKRKLCSVELLSKPATFDKNLSFLKTNDPAYYPGTRDKTLKPPQDKLKNRNELNQRTAFTKLLSF